MVFVLECLAWLTLIIVFIFGFHCCYVRMWRDGLKVGTILNQHDGSRYRITEIAEDRKSVIIEENSYYSNKKLYRVEMKKLLPYNLKYNLKRIIKDLCD